MTDKQYISTPEAAKILGISRVAVFDRIKKGKIPAKKVGRNYIIDKSSIVRDKGAKLTKTEKELINKVVDRTIKEYSKTLKQLADA